MREPRSRASGIASVFVCEVATREPGNNCADPGGAQQRPVRHMTHPRVGPDPVSGVPNLDDQAKNAGGSCHSLPSTLWDKILAYEVVEILAKNILS